MVQEKRRTFTRKSLSIIYREAFSKLGFSLAMLNILYLSSVNRRKLFLVGENLFRASRDFKQKKIGENSIIIIIIPCCCCCDVAPAIHSTQTIRVLPHIFCFVL